jgi:hypothetical protein
VSDATAGDGEERAGGDEEPKRLTGTGTHGVEAAVTVSGPGGELPSRDEGPEQQDEALRATEPAASSGGATSDDTSQSIKP